MTLRTHSLLPGLLITVSILTGPVAAIADASGNTVHQIEISVFQFQPDTLDITVGDTVRWTNRDGIRHSATAESGGVGGQAFDTGLFGKGEMQEVTFSEPGTYSYFCTRHPSMTGMITVSG